MTHEESQSMFLEYLKCFRELTTKERDVLMDLLKLETTTIIVYKKN